MQIIMFQIFIVKGVGFRLLEDFRFRSSTGYSLYSPLVCYSVVLNDSLKYCGHGYKPLSSIVQGRIQDFRKGVSGHLVSSKTPLICMHACDVFMAKPARCIRGLALDMALDP